MAPTPQTSPLAIVEKLTAGATKPTSPEGLALEGWAQGFLVGAIVVMAAITVANMRRGVLLHKLILFELFLGIFHPFFILFQPPVYGWYISATAILLNSSWSLHNVIAWLKIRPFLSRRWSIVFIGTIIIAQPYWIVEIYANFTYFNNINNLFVHTRPYEAIFRDPWWIISIIILMYSIHSTYKLPFTTIVGLSPRFGILFAAMILSIIFIILDILAVTTHIFSTRLPDGLNPFWKLAMAFKCLTDSIILDDFKTALDKLMRYKMRRERANQRLSSYPETADERDTLSGLSRQRTVEFDPLGEDAAQDRIGSGSAEPGEIMDFATALNPAMNPKDRARRIEAMANNVDSYDIELPEFQTDSTEYSTSAGSSSKTSKSG